MVPAIPALLEPRLDDFARPSAEAVAFLGAILRGDHRAVRRIAVGALQHGLAHLHQDIVQPAMEEVGRLWEADRISVAEEHLATAIVESTLASIYPEIAWPVAGPRAIVACVERERHQLGARMAADLLAFDGWHADFLGADVPGRALVELARDRRPVLVGLSISLRGHLSGVRSLIRALRAAAPGVRVIVGGQAAAAMPSPAVLGADALPPSGVDAVAIARAWKP